MTPTASGPAVSDAVVSGINSSDVICIAAGRSYAVTAEHGGDAVDAAEKLLEIAREAAASQKR